MINRQIKSNELTLVAPPSSKISFEKDGFIILYFYFKNNVFSTFFQTTLRYAHYKNFNFGKVLELLLELCTIFKLKPQVYLTNYLRF